MYAVTTNGYRSIAPGDVLQSGERVFAEVPLETLRAIEIAEKRLLRNDILRGCDWTQAPDSPLALIDKQAWATYRAALRALPQQPGFPDVEWPRPPNLADGTADQPDPSSRTSPTRA
ncbi:tail fiber assembly protein [Lysobacter sp. 22409]|uniref:tail fiber assembly protein n=1 Tax=Lysobacter sp. 22409 TaxID=3453917 RepID=UPI003F845FDF